MGGLGQLVRGLAGAKIDERPARLLALPRSPPAAPRGPGSDPPRHLDRLLAEDRQRTGRERVRRGPKLRLRPPDAMERSAAGRRPAADPGRSSARAPNRRRDGGAGRVEGGQAAGVELGKSLGSSCGVSRTRRAGAPARAVRTPCQAKGSEGLASPPAASARSMTACRQQSSRAGCNPNASASRAWPRAKRDLGEDLLAVAPGALQPLEGRAVLESRFGERS